MWPFLIGVSSAQVALPSYRDELARSAWYAINDTIENACAHQGHGGTFCDKSMLADAIREAEHFQAHLFHDARLDYLSGLAWNLRGYPTEAERKFRAALRADRDRQDAWHDLGELLLTQRRYDEAGKAFAEVTRLVPADQPGAWIGPWRQAEVAAHRHDPEQFEDHLREALRRGFSFRQIAGLPNWKAFYADPAMRDSIEKLVTVYGEPSVLDSLSPTAN